MSASLRASISSAPSSVDPAGVHPAGPKDDALGQWVMFRLHLGLGMSGYEHIPITSQRAAIESPVCSCEHVVPGIRRCPGSLVPPRPT